MAVTLPGKKLEGLVAALEKVLNRTGAKIEAPCRRLVDRDTGKAREHDVVITWDHGHHTIVTAIECRDRSRPVGVPDVEAFADKCAATGVHSGVIVSGTGFRKTARIKAQVRGIICMELAEVGAFDWLGIDKITGCTRKITQVNFKTPDGPPLSRDTFEGAFYSESGRRVPVPQLARFAISRIPLGPLEDEPIGEEHTVTVPLVTKGWTVRGKDGALHPIETIIAEVTTELTITASPISTHRYRGNGKDYAVASADIPNGHGPGRIVMVENEDKSTSIFLVPERSKGA